MRTLDTVATAIGLAAAEVEVVGGFIVSGTRGGAGELFVGLLDVERGDELAGNLVFNGEQILGDAGELLAPDALAVGDVFDVDVNGHARGVALDGALDDEVDAEAAGRFFERVFIRDAGDGVV